MFSYDLVIIRLPLVAVVARCVAVVIVVVNCCGCCCVVVGVCMIHVDVVLL